MDDDVKRLMWRSNCLVTASQSVKIADFGLSRDVHYKQCEMRLGLLS